MYINKDFVFISTQSNGAGEVLLNICRLEFYGELVHVYVGCDVPGYELSGVQLLPGTASPGYEFFWVQLLPGMSSRGYNFSRVRFLLGTTSPGYEFSWVQVLLGMSSPAAQSKASNKI